MRRDQRCVGSSHGDDPAEGREREKLNKPGSMYKMLSLGLFCLYHVLPHLVIFMIEASSTAADERKDETHERINGDEKIRPGASVQLPVQRPREKYAQAGHCGVINPQCILLGNHPQAPKSQDKSCGCAFFSKRLYTMAT